MGVIIRGGCITLIGAGAEAGVGAAVRSDTGVSCIMSPVLLGLSISVYVLIDGLLKVDHREVSSTAKKLRATFPWMA